MSEAVHTHDSPGHGSPQPPYAADPIPAGLFQLKNVCGLAGIIGVVLFILLGLILPAPTGGYFAFRGLLVAFVFWLSCTLGPMAFVMITHMTGGAWGVVMRRFAEAAFLNLPLMLLVCVCLSFGYAKLFPWAHMADFHGEDLRILHHREIFYNGTAFFVRSLIYFGIWATFAVALRVGSLKMDTINDPVHRRKLRLISAGGLVLFFVTTLFYAMDYILSRETKFYSSIIGFITDIDMGAAGMSLVTLSVCLFARRRPLRTVLHPQHLNDLGNILLALVILWMYTSFAQFLIIWNGNIRDDNSYYIFRGFGLVPNGWRYIAAVLVVGHFFVPFFLLLMKGLKRKTFTLGVICAWLLVMRIIETEWLVGPSGAGRSKMEMQPAHPIDFIALVAVGGLWMWNYLRILSTQPLMPRNATHQPSEIVTHGTAAHAHAL